jgi:hypothetical protein
MTRTTVLLALLTISTVLFGQQDWQGDVKKLYPVELPSYQGARPVYGLSKKTATTPDIELYSLTVKLTDLKTPAELYRTSLEKQGFKYLKSTSTATLERIELVNSARKLGAVVVASKQPREMMLIGVTVLPESGLPK